MTKTNGKRLEEIVAYVEQALVPSGFEVKVNPKLFDEDGVQIAEFDVEVRGKIGTGGEVAWLIECRDRPASGAAPGSWIQQLAGRKKRYKFHMVTAVSTTGFSPGARKDAEELGIELREVSSTDPKEFSWLQVNAIPFQTRTPVLKHVELFLEEGSPLSVGEYLKNTYDKLTPTTDLLVSEKGHRMTAHSVFTQVLNENPDLWSDAVPNGDPHDIAVKADFDASDPVYLETDVGRVRVVAIGLQGSQIIHQSMVMPAASKYQQFDGGETYSEIAQFDVAHGEHAFSLEMHRISKSGETKLTLRKK